ncbi:MAG TPA: hypothetical protein VK105_08260 [Virgibacillus sp.]|nr:hypothetical protein [Virgibacillus sp.]HLR67112.1 hypothetical protein [Virgibacillus sp.]
MMQEGWLIYNKQDAEKNKTFIDWFIGEAYLQNLSLKLIFREELTIGIMNNERIIYKNGKRITQPDFAIVRTIEPLLNKHLEACGITAFNSSNVARICNNKALTHHYITDLSIPMVDTIYIKKELITATPPISYPFVIKDVLGRGGKQVYMIENYQEWLEGIEKYIENDIIIQRCDVQLGKDIRVFVVGKEIIGAVLRMSTNDFRANFKLGGSARWYELNDNETSMINKIINYFDFDMVGIDFLIGANGEMLFNEIEDVVGSRTLSSVSHINILREYVKHIKQKLSN